MALKQAPTPSIFSPVDSSRQASKFCLAEFLSQNKELPAESGRRLVTLRYDPTPSERASLEQLIWTEVVTHAKFEPCKDLQGPARGALRGDLLVEMKGEGVSYDVRGCPRQTPGLEHLHIGTWRAETVDVRYAHGLGPTEDAKEALSPEAYRTLVYLTRFAIMKHRIPLGDGQLTVLHVSPRHPENPLVRPRP